MGCGLRPSHSHTPVNLLNWEGEEGGCWPRSLLALGARGTRAGLARGAVGSLAVRECVALGSRGWEAVRVRTLVCARPHVCTYT